MNSSLCSDPASLGQHVAGGKTSPVKEQWNPSSEFRTKKALVMQENVTISDKLAGVKLLGSKKLNSQKKFLVANQSPSNCYQFANNEGILADKLITP